MPGHMNQDSLKSLLESFQKLSILVFGDFFLDRYLMVDSGIAETSVETGLEAHQVVEIRNSPGAAGTVTNNLCALGVGNVIALGIVGEDGHGFDLLQGLESTGVDTTHLIRAADRYTPTYTKPIRTSTGEEMSRLDVKNRSPTPEALEATLIERFDELYPQVDGVIVLDQVQEADCGVVSSRVRDRIAKRASENDRPVLADSRAHIADFSNVILKPNEDELADLIQDRAEPVTAAQQLSQQTDRPVILTRGAHGIIASKDNVTTVLRGIPVPDPIDIVGAGDSVSASVTAALAAGAPLQDAALLGILASSITVQQIGTTGTATPSQILDRFQSTYPAGYHPTPQS
jgi:rfaE bifunctional protein kinase chain/domain